MTLRTLSLLAPLISLVPAVAFGSSGSLSEEAKRYSPYANSPHATNVYWGDSHIHTGLSLDAGLFGNTLVPDDAYRFARGEQITSSTGIPVRLSRSLDWAVITDHTDLMGFATDLQRGAPNILEIEKGRYWYEEFKKGGKAAGAAAFDLIGEFCPDDLAREDGQEITAPAPKVFDGVWGDIVDSAERNNDSGDIHCLHRVRMDLGAHGLQPPQECDPSRRREGGEEDGTANHPAADGQHGPQEPVRVAGDLSRPSTVARAFAFAHNGNLSNGWLFPTE